MSRGRLAGRPYPLTHHTTLGWSPGQRDGVLAGGGWLWWFAGGQPRSSRSLPPCSVGVHSTIDDKIIVAVGFRRAEASGTRAAAGFEERHDNGGGYHHRPTRALRGLS